MAIAVVPAPRQIDLGLGDAVRTYFDVVNSRRTNELEKKRNQIAQAAQESLAEYRKAQIAIDKAQLGLSADKIENDAKQIKAYKRQVGVQEKQVDISEDRLGLMRRELNATLGSFKQAALDERAELKRQIKVKKEQGEDASKLKSKYNRLKDMSPEELTAWGRAQTELMSGRKQLNSLRQQIETQNALLRQTQQQLGMMKTKQDIVNQSTLPFAKALEGAPEAPILIRQMRELTSKRMETDPGNEEAMKEIVDTRDAIYERALDVIDRNREAKLKILEREESIKSEAGVGETKQTESNPYGPETQKLIADSSTAEVEAAWKEGRRVPIKWMEPGSFPGGKPGATFIGIEGPKAGYYTKTDALRHGWSEEHWKEAPSVGEKYETEGGVEDIINKSIENMTIEELRRLRDRLGE